MTAVNNPDLVNIARKYVNTNDARTAALEFAQTEHALTTDDFSIEHSYDNDDPKSTHVFLRQMVHGVKVEAATMNIHVDEDKQIIAYSNSFHIGPKPVKLPAWSPGDQGMLRSVKRALQQLALHIGTRLSNIDAIDVSPQTSNDENDVKYTISKVPFSVQPIKVKRVYVHSRNNRLDLAWEFTVRLAIDYICAHVSISNPRVLALDNWTSKFLTYSAIPVGQRNIRTTRPSNIVNPQNDLTNKIDWHTVNGRKSTDLSGNNAVVESWLGDAKIEATDGRFVFPYNTVQGRTKNGVVNAFYVVNSMHDTFKNYGFKENNGNFQQVNFRKGGASQDPIRIYAQSPLLVNNAAFCAAPDGQSGEMIIGHYRVGNTLLDLTWSNEILIHEVAHGLSRRIIGSPYNSNIFPTMEAMGLAEGWSDFISIWALMTKQSSAMDNVPFTTYLLPMEIRVLSYSSNTLLNPLTYGFIQLPEFDEEHNMGTVWATILYEVYWALARVLKFSEKKDVPSSYACNTLMLKLLIYGMSLTPEIPTFITARDAILQAEKSKTKGKYHCRIWRAFANRGLGVNAKPYVEGVFAVDMEDFNVPSECLQQDVV
ncbi:Fungalysin metallopeptidase-domain-containing protein [Syncephalis plumigaleata]|nr:Fungalysin metallopeptidase-domain-containing protein [Syncephalis plumigaleata]